MGLLYPRLLSEQARLLYGELNRKDLQQLVQQAATAHDAAVYVATGGDRVSENRLRALRRLVLDLAAEAGFPDRGGTGLRTQFDLRLAETLHSEMDLIPAEAASGDVWAFLALVLLPDVAFWRYPNNRERILGTDLTRHVFGRMWWRAQLVYDPGAEEPYEALKVLGEAAFDQIYARRKALGNSPHLVKGILRVWNSLDLTGLSERDVLRDFLKRLLRLAPFVLFESLDDRTLAFELARAAKESVSAFLLSEPITEREMKEKTDVVFASVEAESSLSAALSETDDTGRALAGSLSEKGNASEPRAGEREPIPYETYEGPDFGDLRNLGLNDLADAIVRIVSVEGPVTSDRVLRMLNASADAAVDQRLLAAVKYAVRTGRLRSEGGSNQTASSTLSCG